MKVTIDNRVFELGGGRPIGSLLDNDQLLAVRRGALTLIGPHGIYDPEQIPREDLVLELRPPKRSELRNVALGRSAVVFSDRQPRITIKNQLDFFGVDCRATDCNAIAVSWVQEAVQKGSLPDLIVWSSARMEQLKAVLAKNQGTGVRPVIISFGGESYGTMPLFPEEMDDREKMAGKLLMALGRI